MTIRELFEKLDEEHDKHGEHGFDPVSIAEQVIRQAIERAEPAYKVHTYESDPAWAGYMGAGYNRALDDYQANLIKELGLDEPSDKGAE